MSDAGDALTEQSTTRQPQAARTRRLARAVTYAGHPSLVFALVVCFAALRLSTERTQALKLCAAAVVFMLLIPTVYTLIILRMGLISDILLTERSERRFLFLPMGVIFLSGFLVFKWLSAPAVLLGGGVCGAIGLFAASVITRWWKVSLHTGGLGGVAAVLMHVWWPAAVFMIPATVFVGWSRVALREHTVAQVIVGGLLGFSLTAVQMPLVLSLMAAPGGAC